MQNLPKNASLLAGAALGVTTLGLACATPGPAALKSTTPPPQADPRPTAPSEPPLPSVQTIDWQNRSYELREEEVGEMFAGTFPVVSGNYDWKHDDDDHGWFHVTPAEYGDIDGDKRDEAALIITYNGGGTGQFSLGLVYGYQGHELVLRGTIPGGDRADGGLREVRVLPGAVEVLRLGTSAGACCPTSETRERWRWTKRGFQEDESARQVTELDE